MQRRQIINRPSNKWHRASFTVFSLHQVAKTAHSLPGCICWHVLTTEQLHLLPRHYLTLQGPSCLDRIDQSHNHVVHGRLWNCSRGHRRLSRHYRTTLGVYPYLVDLLCGKCRVGIAKELAGFIGFKNGAECRKFRSIGLLNAMANIC